jgi:amino acid transporter
VLRMAPRILFGIGRDGLLTVKAALGSDSGTPLTAVAITSAIIIIVILTGTFEQIIR